MPRSHKRDNAETMARNFIDPRSFVALFSGCDVLYGKDKTARRKEIYERAHGRCELQSSHRCRGFSNWLHDEIMDGWHHTYEHDGKKCDCLSTGRWACDPCHRQQHSSRNPRWQRQAVKDFNKLYGGADERSSAS